MNHKIKLSGGGTVEVSEHDLVNLEHYKQAAEYNRKGWEAADARDEALAIPAPAPLEPITE